MYTSLTPHSFLTSPSDRLGRTGVQQIRQHGWFSFVDWPSLAQRKQCNVIFGHCSLLTMLLEHPPNPLLLPHAPRLTGSTSFVEVSGPSDNQSSPFDFSHLFKSSPGSTVLNRSIVQTPPQREPQSDFLGFSWGPMMDAFDNAVAVPVIPLSLATPSGSARSNSHYLQVPGGLRPRLRAHANVQSSSPQPFAGFATPIRPSLTTSIPQTVGTSQRRKRMVSDREALQQMINLVSASARKKVMESGRKPRFSIGTSNSLPAPERSRIPGLLVKRARPELQQLNTSLSLDESAPPSPSPRPGSALSRRSGSASPFPFVRSSAPSFMLDPTNTNVTSTGVTLLSIGPDSSRTKRTVSWQEDQRRRQAMVLPADVLDLEDVSDARERTSDVSIGILESDLDRLLRELANIEKRVSSLKVFAKVDAALV